MSTHTPWSLGTSDFELFFGYCILGADADTHDLTLSGAKGTPQKRGEMIGEARGVEDTGERGPQNQLSRIYRGSQRPKLQSGSLYWFELGLGSLHKPYGCIA